MITKRMSDVLKLLRRLAITHTLSLCPFDPSFLAPVRSNFIGNCFGLKT
jgi:hypothetical protein